MTIITTRFVVASWVGVVLGLIAFALVGCGDVTALSLDASDAAGTAGTGGGPGTGGTTGEAGTTGTGGSVIAGTGGSAPTCVPDACNDCVDAVLVPKRDGTMCGPGLCDGVLPYVGQGGCVSKNQACVAGVCVTTTVDCCRKCPTPGPQSRCTADAPEDPTVPSFCSACAS